MFVLGRVYIAFYGKEPKNISHKLKFEEIDIMSKFAYLDKGNVLHITDKKETAKEYSKNGRVVETEHPARGGYPVVADEEILVYNETTMKLDGGSPDTLESALYPQLSELYRQCR